MGERPQTAPPLAVSPSAQGRSLCEDALAGLKWPPPGWPMFSCVTRAAGTAVRPKSDRSEDDFIKYEVSATPDGIYQVEILAVRLTRDGGTAQSPVIGMRFAAREDWFDDNPQNSVVDIHVRGQRLLPEKSAILRVILALTFVISRIDRGMAPSLKRVLALYRLA